MAYSLLVSAVAHFLMTFFGISLVSKETLRKTALIIVDSANYASAIISYEIDSLVYRDGEFYLLGHDKNVKMLFSLDGTRINMMQTVNVASLRKEVA